MARLADVSDAVSKGRSDADHAAGQQPRLASPSPIAYAPRTTLHAFSDHPTDPRCECCQLRGFGGYSCPWWRRMGWRACRGGRGRSGFRRVRCRYGRRLPYEQDLASSLDARHCLGVPIHPFVLLHMSDPAGETALISQRCPTPAGRPCRPIPARMGEPAEPWREKNPARGVTQIRPTEWREKAGCCHSAEKLRRRFG